MKTSKILSAVLVVALLCNILCPIAYAEGSGEPKVEYVNYTDNIVMYGFEDTEKVANFSVNTDTLIVDFATKYFSNPDYLHEYQFKLQTPEIKPSSRIFWDDIYSFCLQSSSEWSVLYIPDIIGIETVADVEGMRATASTAYFDDYLANLYGSQYTDRLLNLKSTGGVTMRIYEGLQLYVHQINIYTAYSPLSIVSFITAVIAAALTNGLYNAISIITGGISAIPIGKKVFEYRLRANWYRYVYVNSHTYPYSMCNKFIYRNGYEYSDTGTQAIDVDSVSTDYVPSASYFNTYSMQYDAAYLEYQRLGPIN